MFRPGKNLAATLSDSSRGAQKPLFCGLILRIACRILSSIAHARNLVDDDRSPYGPGY